MARFTLSRQNENGLAVLPRLPQHARRERQRGRQLRHLRLLHQPLLLFQLRVRPPLADDHVSRSTGARVGQVRRGAGGAAEPERAEADGGGGAVSEVRRARGGVLYRAAAERGRGTDRVL